MSDRASGRQGTTGTDDKVAALLEGATVRKVIAVPDKMVNFVIA